MCSGCGARRSPAAGTVEVDETFIGGEQPGLCGGRQPAKKAMVAVERAAPRGLGRRRMALLADASAGSLRGFLTDHLQEGATVKLLPGVHTVASLAKRWPLGTHQGAVDEPHMASYLNEFGY